MYIMPLYPNYYATTTKFVFECDACHGEIIVYRKDTLITCSVCGKKLCEKCVRFTLCPSDLARIPTEGQDKLNQIGEKYRLAVETATRQRIILFRNFSIAGLAMVSLMVIGVIFIGIHGFVGIILTVVLSVLAVPIVLKNTFAILAKDQEKINLQEQCKVDHEKEIQVYLPTQDIVHEKKNSGP